MRLISSETALLTILALSHENPLGLADLARALGVTPSSAQRGLEVLQADGLVEATGSGRRRRFRLTGHPAVDHLVGLARTSVPPDVALGVVARSRPAIEMVAREADRLLVVFSASSDPIAQSYAARALDSLGAAHGL